MTEMLGRSGLRRTGLVVGILAALAAILYGDMLGHFFLTDDYTWMELGRLLSDGHLSALLGRPGGHLRPLQILVFGVIQHWFGLNPLPYHLVSLSLHVAVCVLVFQLADRLFGSAAWALLGATLFGVMASHALAVSWIATMHDVMTTLFGLGAVLAWLAYLRRGERRHYVLTWALFILALAAKELGVAVAPLLPAAELLLPCGTDRRPLARWLVRYAPFVLAVLVYVALRMPSGAVADFRVGPHVLLNLPALAVFTYVPVTEHIVSALPGIVRMSVSLTWLPGMGLVAALIGYCLVRGGGAGRFALALFLAPLLPVSWYYPPSNLLTLPAAMYSHYTYFPSVGAALCLATLLRDVLGSPRASGVLRKAVWAGVGAYMLANAAAVVTYNETSLRSAAAQARSIVAQLDTLTPLVRADDTLFFDGDSWTWIRMRVGSLFFLFWNLRNPIHLVFAEDSDMAEWSRRWPLGIENRPTVVVGSLRDLALRCTTDDNRLLFTEERGVVRLTRCRRSP